LYIFQIKMVGTAWWF